MNNQDVAKKIVDRMIETIESGQPLPWTKPWSTTRTYREDGYTEITIRPKHWSRSGQPYNGINVLLLQCSGKTGEWITFNQCRAEGGKIRKGAKSSTIIFWKQLVKEDPEDLDDDGNPKKKIIPILKTYSIFNVETDCEGLKEKHQPEPQVVRIPRIVYDPDTCDLKDTKTIDTAETVIADYLSRAKTLTLSRDGISDRAYYSPALDGVTVPNIKQFGQAEEFYSTLFHELGHSTGHKSRLNRFTGKDANAAFGSESYSREELVAEITAAGILNTLGLESGNSFRNSAAYIKSWSEHIKKDPMMFVTASTRAEKAIELILNIPAPAKA